MTRFRIKPKDEIWELRINWKPILKIETKTKGERNILTQIRKGLISINEEIKNIEITNRIERIERNLRMNQTDFIKMKSNTKIFDTTNIDLSKSFGKDMNNEDI